MRPSHIVAVVGVLVCGSVAVPGAPAPQLVREEIAANHLTLDPQVEHLRSTLVIEGRSIEPIVRAVSLRGPRQRSLDNTRMGRGCPTVPIAMC